MPCQFYSGSGCGGCCHFVRTTSITLSGTVLTLTIPAQNINNKQKLCICLAQSLPEGITQDVTVSVMVGTREIMAITRSGNELYADQLRSRKVIHFTAATSLPALVADCKSLCPTAHVFPSLPAQTTPPTPTA